MISRREEVYALLKGAVGDVRVSQAYPGWWAEANCVTFREASNREHARADGRAYLTEQVYEVDVWAATNEEAVAIMEKVDGALTGAGYARAQAIDLFDEKARFYRKSLRYRILTDPEGRGYQ